VLHTLLEKIVPPSALKVTD